jgi:hypothetical protein
MISIEKKLSEIQFGVEEAESSVNRYHITFYFGGPLVYMAMRLCCLITLCKAIESRNFLMNFFVSILVLWLLCGQGG